MLFSSPIFFLFFSLYLPCHVWAKNNLRWTVLILGSLVFYSYWNPVFLWVPLALTLVTFFGVRWVHLVPDTAARRWRTLWLVLALLLPLAYFKYTAFILGNLFGGQYKNPGLPLGISFVSFTLVAYVMDVSRGKFAQESGPTRLLASVLFFPHLIAGPIVRPSQLMPQLSRAFEWKAERAWLGLAVFSWGLFKKLVVSDPVAAVVDSLYAKAVSLSLVEAWFAFYGFALQIYCDFSGYTDMALGAALILGVRLPQNFSRPYLSASLVDFWRRWHMSLSSWLRDYLYISLGGNRAGKLAQYRNLLLTMVLGGLWHGANWTFVWWGALHGLGLMVVHALGRLTRRVAIPRWVAVLATFHFVCVAWVLFRAENLTAALAVWSALFSRGIGDVGAFAETNLYPILMLLLFPLLHLVDSHSRLRLWVRRIPKSLLVPALLVAWLLAMVVSSGSSQQFIYFEF